jgi:hypothetical protein
MLRDIKLWIIVALGIILVIMFIFWPQSESAKIQRLEHENDSLLIRISQHQENAVKLAELRKADLLKTIQTKKVADSVHAADSSTIAKLRTNPRVIEIVKNEPLIDSAFQAYDSAIVHKDERIRELESELTSSQQLASQAEQNFKATIKDYQQLNSNLQEQIAHWQKETKKIKRQKRAAIVLGGLIGIAGFLL